MIFLDLGCGARKREGHIGIDLARVDGVDIICDINKGLCIKDNSVDGVHSCFFLEHTCDLILVLKEVYRVCKNDAIVELVVPYHTSMNAFQDPTHHNFFCEQKFDYFNLEKGLGVRYGIDTNFKVLSIEYYYSNVIRGFYAGFLKRFLRNHIINMVGNIGVKLKVRKGDKREDMSYSSAAAQFAG